MDDTNALSALVRAGALLSDNSFAGTLSMAPALTLQAVPGACRVEMTVTHPDQNDPVRTAATRPSSAAAVSLATRSMSVDIVLEPDSLAGAMVLSTDVIGGFGATEQLAARIMVTQVEAALRCAYAVERARYLARALERGEDIGVAIGLVMASQGLDRVAAFVQVEHLSRAADRPLVDLAREIITAGTVPPPRQQATLRLVGADRTV